MKLDPTHAWPKTRRWSDLHRLRKYRRRADRAARRGVERERLERLQCLKWRYRGKFFRGGGSLWGGSERDG